MSLPPYHWWRTVFFLIPAIGLYTIVLGTVSLLSTFVDRRGHFAHQCARAWSWLILKTTRVTVEVRGALPPGDRSYVFASNHQSIYDIPVLFWTIAMQLRIIAKASLGGFPFLGWHLQRAGHLLVDRDNPGAGVLKKMQRMVLDQASLIIFPEGTRSRDGVVGRFKGGVFLLAIDSNLAVVPVSISGSRHVMLKGRLMTCPGHVRITVHPAIATAGMTRADARALAAQVRDVVAGDVEHD
ncbi:MAG: 1-acyl-sn-glycerol-3-phosphate acyltransferase [Acidobacteria bacterium]|nr:1-acyl-sn-glycerol-3-phosphate acyltransferase [Acidobacteriota bacterium]